MKIVKIEITKERENGQTKLSYPKGFYPEINPFFYQDEVEDDPSGKKQNIIEYCLARVPDDFSFTDKMVEVTETEAESLIDNWTDNHKNLKNDNELKNKMKRNKKEWLTS